MRILFEDARILSMNDKPMMRGDLVVDDNRIVYIGSNGSRQGPFDRVILCAGNVLMPGFKNAHNHSAMTFLRSYADDLALRDWLYNWVFPIEAKLQPSDVYHLSKLAFAEYLTSGITANFDMYYFPKEIARASIEFGMRTVILGTPTSFKESINGLREVYEAINGMSDLVKFRLGFHAEYTSTNEMLVSLAVLANELKTPVFTHISETQNEVNGCIERHGDTPAVYFEKLGLFNYGGGGFHGVYLTDQDMEIFKRRNLHLVTCPSSNTKLASGIAPVQKFLDYGLNLSIGTDGPASNNCLDFFREMFLVTGLSKLKTMDPTSLDGYQVLKMATVGGAKAMGLDGSDTLEVGKLADIIMIDLNRPNMQPLNNIEKNIVYSGSKENIKMTMINGHILYEDGKFFLNEPIEDIYKRAQEVTDRIKQDITK
ncbi:MAG: amidohydrolase [Bacilli bacterium]|jgi:5-methylthioadenosine/S-adenosylhomocysteine deaminase|nr:amidohydrolase [Bacilli bacterium]